jgi:phenylacetic acid degradation operon negative regulatory protein
MDSRMTKMERAGEGPGLPVVSGARGLLLTVLGEFVLPSGGAAQSSALVAALGTLGVEPGTARQVLARSAARGWLVREKVGSRTRWHLTEHARRLLAEGTERIYGFGRRRPGWDGRWLLVVVSVPERHRSLRYRLRTRLTWAGFGALGQGVWLCPYVEREGTAVSVVKSLGLEGATSFLGSFGQLGDVARLVAEAWNLSALGRRYHAFCSWADALDPRGEEDSFAAQARLVHEWRQFPLLDPELPRTLLPDDWEGDQALARFHRLHEEWRLAAWEWWNQQAR